MVHAVHVSFHLISFPLVYHEQPKSSICCSRVTEVIKLSIYFVCPLKGPSANSNSKCIQPSETGFFSFLKCKYFDVQMCKKVSCSLYHDPPFSHCSTLLFFRFRFAPVSRPILHPHTYWNLIWYHWLIAQVWPPPAVLWLAFFYETTVGLPALKGQTARQQRSEWMAHFLAVAWWRGYSSSSLSSRPAAARRTDGDHLKDCVQPRPGHHMGH